MPTGAVGFNESPVVLPSLFGQPGQAMQMAIQNQQQDKQFDYMRQRQADSDLWRRIGLVQDETNPERIATGDITADEWLGNEAKNSMQKILSNPNFATMQPNDLYGLIQREWLPTVDAFKVIKSGVETINQEAKMAGTENKNIASDRLSVEAKKRLINNILPSDETGKRTFNRNIAALPQTSYVQELLNSPERYKFIQSGQPLIDFISKPKLSEISPYKQLADKTIIPYKGKQSPFVKLNITPSEIGQLKTSDSPKYEILSEEDYITDEGGNQVKVRLLDENIYKSIQSVPELNDALDYMWNNYKNDKGVKPKNPAQDEKMKRAFAVGVFETYDPSEITSMTPQHLPRQSSYTNITMGGGIGDRGMSVRDIYKELKYEANRPERPNKRIPINELSPKAQEILINYANKFASTGGDDKFTQADIYVKQGDDDQLYIIDVETGNVITPLNYEDVNLPAQVGVKEKRQTIETAKKIDNTIQKDKKQADKKDDPFGLGL